ncbi:FkbM family methyltransferase [Fulvivirga sedimenti]|uniref:FkbM family methyltransferase n=1 Tax=Fulvivirga sedimenti TaxID=2879465 RepID=A0A9X1HY76_9BACT|nr:FkbM family methyltransferase [Fulvivirga sedimenti]MCA6078712.1 FkbM family methyltransferase [Fulvivirga sedimenti]
MKNFLQNHFHKQLYNSAYSRARFTLAGIALKEIRSSFSQFFTWRYPVRSLLRTFGIILSAILRLFLGRSVKYSFSHAGEDRIIEYTLNTNISYNGYYVDVGSNHPVFVSNTYLHYRKGWRGICIDANEKLIRKYKFYRPRDIAVCALVSDQDTTRDFYIIENDVLSTTEIENLAYPKEHNLGISTIEFATSTLTSILKNNGVPGNFDLLSIDAEEHDFNVLMSLDFSLYTPKLIVLEDETFSLESSSENRIYRFLISKGYVLAGYISKNLYFKRIE